MTEKQHIVGGRDGWLNVKREPSGAIVALAEYTRVEVSSSKGGRDYFEVLEGAERGKAFSVQSGNLGAGSPSFRPAANLHFYLARKLLVYPGGQVEAITSLGNPIHLGAYPIQLPDFPHILGTSYLGQSAFAKTWFYLGHGNAVYGSNDRYLHPGTQTLGCITVDPLGWTRLYQYLILCRKNDGKAIGTVHVAR